MGITARAESIRHAYFTGKDQPDEKLSGRSVPKSMRSDLVFPRLNNEWPFQSPYAGRINGKSVQRQLRGGIFGGIYARANYM